MEPLLSVKNLTTGFKTRDGYAKAVDDISFSIYPGETLGLVGESGCGKSVTSLSILGLIQKPAGKILNGEIIFSGKNLTQMKDEELRKIRGNEISMIFQDPMTALNPVFTCGSQISEALSVHRTDLTSEQVKSAVIEILNKVGIPEPETRFEEYPHQLSGGMRQRIMIAIALICNPKLIIADEPTTALDVTIQAQILELIQNLKSENGSSVLLITHDLGVVAETCNRVAVMYAGKIVEIGTVKEIFYTPRHHYTKGLIDSVPHFESKNRLEYLKTIPGSVPGILDLPLGCRFNERCNSADEECTSRQPELKKLGNQFVACHHPLPGDSTQ